MVELGHRADRLPTRVCVAVLARPDRRPMRVGHLGAWPLPRIRARLRRTARRHSGQCQRQHHCDRDFARYPSVPEAPVHGQRRAPHRLPNPPGATPSDQQSTMPFKELPWTWLTKHPLKKHRRNLFQTPNSLDCAVTAIQIQAIQIHSSLCELNHQSYRLIS